MVITRRMVFVKPNWENLLKRKSIVAPGFLKIASAFAKIINSIVTT
jgi:hypothetical protein